MVPPLQKHVLFVGGIVPAASTSDIEAEFKKFGKCDCDFKVSQSRKSCTIGMVTPMLRFFASPLSLVTIPF